MPDINGPQAVAAIEEKLYAGLAPLNVFCAAVPCTPRTGHTYIAQGMPVVYIGASPYPIVDEAIKWIRSRKRRREPVARKPGRPPNKAA